MSHVRIAIREESILDFIQNEVETVVHICLYASYVSVGNSVTVEPPDGTLSSTAQSVTVTN